MTPENPSTKEELNEEELWALLKDPEESELPGKKRKAPPPEKKQAEKIPQEEAKPVQSKTIITERRKKALVWYLVGLFGIAFVVVLVSLLMRSPSTSNNSETIAALNQQISALTQEKETLQSQVDDLKTENEALTKDLQEQKIILENMNIMMDELSNSLEYTESNNISENEAAKRLQAYQILVRAQNAFIDYNKNVLEESMAELETMTNLLSDEALYAYYMVIEYMEQPYLGQE